MLPTFNKAIQSAGWISARIFEACKVIGKKSVAKCTLLIGRTVRQRVDSKQSAAALPFVLEDVVSRPNRKYARIFRCPRDIPGGCQGDMSFLSVRVCIGCLYSRVAHL
eukprot:764802-Hanusia_phi.AAC.1